jgi:hypothetical protein
MEERSYSAAEVASLIRQNFFGWGVVAALFCVIPAALVFRAVPRFAELFKGFGADLSARTQFVLAYPYLLWVLPALAVLVLVLASTTRAQGVVTRHGLFVFLLVLICGASVVVSGLVIDALYEPIFDLGAVV